VPWCSSYVLVYIYRGEIYFVDGGLVTFVLVAKVCEIHTFFFSIQFSSAQFREEIERRGECSE
jgi:hypothetical protein